MKLLFVRHNSWSRVLLSRCDLGGADDEERAPTSIQKDGDGKGRYSGDRLAMPKRKRGSTCWSSRTVLRRQKLLRDKRTTMLGKLRPCQLIDLCSRCSVGEIREFIKPHDGEWLNVTWPHDTALIMGASGIEDVFSCDDLASCETNYLGRYEPMALLGHVRVGGRRYPVLITDSGPVYIYDKSMDYLCEAADDIRSFLAEGLVRFDSALSPSASSSCSRDTRSGLRPMFFDQKRERDMYIKSLCDFHLLLQASDANERALYVRKHRGEVLTLSWPAEQYLTITDADTLGLSWFKLLRLQDSMAKSSSEPLGVLGVVGGSRTNRPSVATLVVLTGDSGGVYAYMLDSSECLIALAPSMCDFVRVGLSRLIGHYRYQNVGRVFMSSTMSADPASTSSAGTM